MERHMTNFARRKFLQLTTLSTAELLITNHTSAKNARAMKNIGVQLYTVREALPEKPLETLQALAAIGYKEVEVIRRDLDRIAPSLKRAGLKATSIHIEAPLVTGKWAAWRAAAQSNSPLPPDYNLSSAIADAQKHGIKYVVVAYLFPQERGGGLDFYRQFADQMNRAGEQCRKAGLKLCYHNHAFEFERMAGRTPLDVLMERFDGKLVDLELDVFWVAMAGNDPVQLIKRYRGRVPLLHLKDKAKGAERQTQEAMVPAAAFTEVGNGELDFAAILRAASEAGTKHYFVEQDQTPGDPLQSLRQSYTYLQGLKS